MYLKIEDVDASERAELLRWLDSLDMCIGVPKRFVDAAWDALQEDAGVLPDAQPELWEGTATSSFYDAVMRRYPEL